MKHISFDSSLDTGYYDLRIYNNCNVSYLTLNNGFYLDNQGNNISYNIYKWNELIASNISNTSYTDVNLEPSYYNCYTVKALYNNILSDDSNEACATTLDNIIFGCMDSNACNYNSEANEDDGSCEYGCEVYIESNIITTIDDSLLYDIDEFEEDFESFIETQLNLPDGSVDVLNITVLLRSIEIDIEYVIILTQEELNETNFDDEDEILDSLEDIEEIIQDNEELVFIEGCTDEGANNYNEEANIDDESCIYDWFIEKRYIK